MTARVLVIGCGNIGAGYDFGNDHVWTHAKSFSERKDVALTVSDIDESKARRVADRYNARWASDVSDGLLRDQDIVSICVATRLHMHFLSRAVAQQVPVVICEKPLVSSLAEVTALECLDLGGTKILVNYIRRFQPGYADVRRSIATWLQNDPPLAITVRYGRGFLNNAGHAFDLLQYLLGTAFEANNVSWIGATGDGLESDPTRLGVWKWGDIAVFAIGLAGTDYFMLEIDVHTRKRSVTISDGGEKVVVRECDGDVLRQSSAWTSLLTNYMRPVANAAFACLNDNAETNFHSALQLNKTMLRMG